MFTRILIDGIATDTDHGDRTHTASRHFDNLVGFYQQAGTDVEVTVQLVAGFEIVAETTIPADLSHSGE